MNRLAFCTLALAILGAVALPLLFPSALHPGLEKLGIPGDLAAIYFLAMLAGSAINIPLWGFPTQKFVQADPLAVIGLDGLLPHLCKLQMKASIAVNAGGCVIPGVIAIYEVLRIARSEAPHGPLIALVLTAAVSTAVSFKLARLVTGVGIVIPGLLPPLVAVAGALLLSSEFAPPVAFVAGVAGPIAATLLHLRVLRERPVALASIGGAGTFDGILLSVVVAAVLG